MKADFMDFFENQKESAPICETLRPIPEGK